MKLFQDENGNPRTFYHGSCREIIAFQNERDYQTAGIYFTSDLRDAIECAHNNCWEEEDVPTVMSVHLDIQNPAFMAGIESQVISVEKRDELIAMGHDGVVGTINGRPYEYVAFRADQVKIIDVEIHPLQDQVALARL